MSRVNQTTQQLFLKLGATERTRSTKADALFRRLRKTDQEKLSETLNSSAKRFEDAVARTKKKQSESGN